MFWPVLWKISYRLRRSCRLPVLVLKHGQPLKVICLKKDLQLVHVCRRVWPWNLQVPEYWVVYWAPVWVRIACLVQGDVPQQLITCRKSQAARTYVRSSSLSLSEFMTLLLAGVHISKNWAKRRTSLVPPVSVQVIRPSLNCHLKYKQSNMLCWSYVKWLIYLSTKVTFFNPTTQETSTHQWIV